MPSKNEFLCPYCASPNILPVDLSGASRQECVTDCEVCCRPIKVKVQLGGQDIAFLDAEPENI